MYREYIRHDYKNRHIGSTLPNLVSRVDPARVLPELALSHCSGSLGSVQSLRSVRPSTRVVELLENSVHQFSVIFQVFRYREYLRRSIFRHGRPTFWGNYVGQNRVLVDNPCEDSPRTAKKNRLLQAEAVCSTNITLLEDVPGGLSFLGTTHCCDSRCFLCSNGGRFEPRSSITEDKIRCSFNVAIFIVLCSRFGIQSILVSEEFATVKAEIFRIGSHCNSLTCDSKRVFEIYIVYLDITSDKVDRR
jgi:hypothetical protein